MKMNREESGLACSIATFLRHSKKTVLLIVVVATVTLVVSALVSTMLDNNYNIELPSIGKIHTVGVKAYWDLDLQNETKEIQWGTLYTGESYNTTLYLQSISNVPTTLRMEYNWTLQDSKNITVFEPNATASDYLKLSWNSTDQNLNPNEITQTTLTLTMNDSIEFIRTLISKDVEQFTMNITIRASEK